MRMNNIKIISGVLSLATIICLVLGWFQLFSPEMNDFLYQKLFYILVGLTFFVQASLLLNRKLVIPMYVAGVFCIAGIFFPADSQLSGIKTIGLLTGVIISLFNRPSFSQR